MRDVARRAGVSLKTVSRVVNAESGVSDELAAKVREAAASLDYRHNLAARNLRLSQPGITSFAVLVQDLSNGYSAELLRAVDDVARRRQSVMIAASLDEEADRERDLVANLINRRVDGLILMPASQDLSYLAADMAAGFRVVIIDRAIGGVDTDSVLVDNVAGAALGTKHLLEHGHRRVAVVTDDQGIVTAQERLHGYRQALCAAGVTYDPELVGSARTAADASEQVMALMSRPDPPTAIFAARNDVSLGAVMALRQSGRSSEVALVGFDDFPLASVLVPALTVVAQDPAEVGRRAAGLLLDRLSGNTAAPQHLVLQTRLIARGSGEITPAVRP
jgi:LacI family transcriptional regulator